MSRLGAAWLVLRAWARSEPVRLRVYASCVPVLALLVARGIITGSDVPFLQAALLAILGITGTETARSKVTPVSKAETPAQPPRHAANGESL